MAKVKIAGTWRVMGDGSENLTQLGIKNNAKDSLLVGAAATALAKRHADGSMPIEDFNIVLEDQSGKKVQMGSETDQRAIMMGLMLHTNAKQLITGQNYQDALEVLSMGEEAFSLCDPKVIELVDNPSILQIDMVWCYFMLRDINWLSVAGIRLDKAREGLERAHGKTLLESDSFRRSLSRACTIFETGAVGRGWWRITVVRLINQGKVLTSAQEKFTQLQVPDEISFTVMSMGFRERDAKRALRDEQPRYDIRRRDEIMEQKKYGTTPLKKAVDLEKLNQLVSIGFEKELAAEALRRNENDSEKALDDLTNPETNSSIQQHLESRKSKRQRQAVDASVEALVRMGFERALAVEALQAIRCNPTVDANNNSQSDAASDIANSLASMLDNQNGQVGGPSTSSERDEEMESELAEELAQGDAFSDYDLEVTKEGEAINEYLALLNSAGAQTAE
ncbi:hypothetical protein M0R45_003085 [Rubus argutus]|uniref:UBA domain-containing protein n=1 Tax=Rubus argutus TaxID=59490 RepID=A0AAW1YE08_RUBAR